MAPDSGREPLDDLRDELVQAITKTVAKHRKHKPEGVIARPGDRVYWGGYEFIVSNWKQHEATGNRYGVFPVVTIRGVNQFSIMANYNNIFTLDGRPIIGFRDNDE